MVITQGLNHLGLTVKDLKQSTSFFVDLLGWTESGFDQAYPRTSVTDGKIRLTLWQADSSEEMTEFNRKTNVGLHHLALELATEDELLALYETMKSQPFVDIAFAPEFMGAGPRKHFMCHDPSGIRIEFVWPGN